MIFGLLAFVALAALCLWQWRSLAQAQRLMAELQERRQQAPASDELPSPVVEEQKARLEQDLSVARLELSATKENAHAAAEARTSFLANLGAEILSPMKSIMGMTSLLLDTEVTSEQRESLDQIRAAADRLLTVANDVSDLAALESGKFILDPISFNLEDALLDAINSLTPLAQKKGIELACHIQRSVPEVLFGDIGRLRQVVTNLMANAIRCARIGDITLNVAIDHFGDDHVCLQFSVSGDDVVIPPELREGMLAPFVQSAASHAQTLDESGLQLHVSARIIDMFGGRCWIESAAGSGTTLHFTARLQLTESSLLRAIPKPVDIRGLRVLVVDDNASASRILRDTLAGWDLNVTVAETGEQGIQAYRDALKKAQPYGLIIVDLFMSDIDGLAFAERIRQIPAAHHVNIILLSAAGQRGDAARCRNAGIAGYLSKPVKRSELLACILAVSLRHSEDRESTLVTRHSLREGPLLDVATSAEALANPNGTSKPFEKMLPSEQANAEVPN